MMKLIFSFFTMLVSFAVQANLKTELMFSSATEVSPRSDITLYDIVEAKNLTDELVEELKSITVADGAKTRIEKAELSKLLRPLKARFILPSEIKIMRSQNLVSRMEVERKLKNYLHMTCLNCDVEVQISSIPTNIPSDWVMDYSVDLTKSSVMVPIYSVSQSDKKGWIVAQIKRVQTIPVLNRAVRMGDVIAPEMITLEKRKLTNPRETIMLAKSLEGMQASRFLSAGQALFYSDLKRETVVKRGQMVKVLVGTSAFEVTLQGQVEESGSVGDIVRVKNPDTQKVFGGRVIDRGLVRIE